MIALSQAYELAEFRFKPNEKTLFRDLNQSPLIMFPIKDTVNQTWHKVFLMIQVHLGSIQYTDSSEGGKLQRNLMGEKKAIFERLQRLARAVIDCKGYDRDAVGVRTALELARALAAESWEGRTTQLTQIPGIGPVGMRKLAGKNIRTVLELVSKEADEIERLMSRQPPFGKKMKADLEKFPQLALDLTTSGHKLQPRKTEEPVVINVTATIRYLNRKTAPMWKERSPVLTFFAESDNGTLVYFWRGTMRKVDKVNGLELKFTAGLQNATSRITCHLSCEEIVGTEVTKVLQHGLADSIFPPGSSASVPSLPGPRSTGDSFEYQSNDGLDDNDLIEAAERAMAASSSIHEKAETKLRCVENGQSQVEDSIVLSSCDEPRHQQFNDQLAAEGDEDAHLDHEGDSHSEPVQLPNGRWRCNHACSGDGRTKSGKPCTHKCCKEGLDKPRKKPIPKPKKRKEEEMTVGGTIKALSPFTSPFNNTPTVKATPVPSPKRTKLPQNGRKPASGDCDLVQRYPWKRMDISELALECVDLSNVDDDQSFPSLSPVSENHKLPVTVAAGETERSATIPRAQTNNIKRPQPVVNRPRDEHPRRGSQTHLAVTMSGIDTFMPDSDDRFADLNERDLSKEQLFFSRVKIPKRKSPFQEGARDEALYQGIDVTGDDEFPHVNTLPHVDSSTAQPAKVLPMPSDDEWDDMYLDIVDGIGDAHTTKTSNSSASDTIATTVVTTLAGTQTGQATEETAKQEAHKDEPAWVAEFDPEFLDLFRGFVTFV